MSEYFDIRCGDDFDLFARDARPLEVLAQDVYHWLITNKMTLIRAPDWGKGLESYLGRPLPSTLAGDIEGDVVQVFSDRISAAKCTITSINGADDSFQLDLKLEVDGAFLDIALALTPSGIVRVA